MRADESLLYLCDPPWLHCQLAARLARFGLSFARSVGSLGAMRRGSVCLRGVRLSSMRLSAVRLPSVRLSSMRLSAVRLPGVRRWFAACNWMSGGSKCRRRRQSREHCQRQASSKSQHAGSPLRRQFLAGSYIDSLAICPVLQQEETPIGIRNTKACGKGAGSGTSPLAPLQTLLQRSAYQVDAIVGMARVHNFKHHVVARLEFARHGIELLLAARGHLVDANNNQARLQPLQVGE